MKIYLIAAITFCVLMVSKAYSESLMPFEKLVKDADWIVIGEIRLDLNRTVLIKVKDDGKILSSHEFVPGKIRINTVIAYFRKELDGIPGRLPIIVNEFIKEKIPIDKETIWILRANSVLAGYEAIWLNPELYPEARKILRTYEKQSKPN